LPVLETLAALARAFWDNPDKRIRDKVKQKRQQSAEPAKGKGKRRRSA
jgi:hypothetical protein